MSMDIHFSGFTVTGTLLTAVICLAAVLVAWYTVRSRVRFSQIILGMFCYVLVLLLENLFGLLSEDMSPLAYGAYVTVTAVLARELVRFPAMRYGVRGHFDTANAAIGFALGFAGLYLLICAYYYFSLYAIAREYVRVGLDEYIANAGTDYWEAVSLLESIAGQSGWMFLATALNRVFFLVREISLCVLLWYAMGSQGDKRVYILVPLMHLVAMVPDGLYQAELLQSSILRDMLVCALSGGIAALAARQYNRNENRVAHYRLEHLRARRRR